jgi:hypothetical protein
MRNILVTFLVICSAAAAVTAFAQQRQTAPVVSVRLTTDTPTVRMGAPIRVRAILTNDSNQPVMFNVSVQGNCRFGVSDARGAVPRRPRTAFADWPSGGASHLGPELSVMPAIATLNAGASRGEEVTISDLFSFDRAGTYQIRATHPDPVSNAPVDSNPIVIAVIP